MNLERMVEIFREELMREVSSADKLDRQHFVDRCINKALTKIIMEQQAETGGSIYAQTDFTPLDLGPVCIHQDSIGRPETCRHGKSLTARCHECDTK